MRNFIFGSFVLLAACGTTVQSGVDAGARPVSCGNGRCEAGETIDNCCQDCGCPSGQSCTVSGACAATQTCSCGGRSCGDDGCGHSCGTCPSGQSCSASGSCGCSKAPTGSSCNVNGDCCNFLAGTGQCVNFGSGGLCADSCTSNAGCNSGCCQTTTAGDHVCAPSSFCTNLPLGAPCSDNGECTSGFCAYGWCSEVCSSSTGCPNSPLMWCVHQTSANICWPGCSTNSDCAQYGTNLHCGSYNTVEGVSESLCST